MSTLSEDCSRIAQQSPLILNITNYVAMNFTANVLLAVGASPIMSSEKREAAILATAADAIVINIGCLEERQLDAILEAVACACDKGKPWVLDPVGVGMSSFRSSAAEKLIFEFHPTLIRGNAAEIGFLSASGNSTSPLCHGVDCPNGRTDALQDALLLARKSGAVVCVSGEVDIVTDGVRILKIVGGSPLMRRVTAMGCAASSLCAAFLAVNGESLQAASNAMTMMKISGQRSASLSRGPGSFVPNFLDALYDYE